MISVTPPHGAVVERLESDADLDLVADLEARCFSNPWTRDMLARELANASVAHVFILRLPDCPIAAFCSCWIIDDELHVNTMAVDFPYRRRGLGRYLMAWVMSEAARRGARHATLEVRKANDAARRLYESIGFVVTATRRGYYTNPDDDGLILWKEGLTHLNNPESWSGQS
jgi:[ribosomal protein S18]-alanine N-acetyltransferase